MESQTEYIPSVSDQASYQSWEKIKYAIAGAKEHESYLSVKQLAMAIFCGLCVFKSEGDVESLARELVELSLPPVRKDVNLPF